jgi:hypothetical protein
MKKKFDCVKMMHDAQEKVMAEVKGMTLEEEAAWHHARAQEIMATWEKEYGVKFKSASREPVSSRS